MLSMRTISKSNHSVGIKRDTYSSLRSVSQRHGTTIVKLVEAMVAFVKSMPIDDQSALIRGDLKPVKGGGAK